MRPARRGQQRLGRGPSAVVRIQAVVVAAMALVASASALADPADPANAELPLGPDRVEDVATDIGATDPRAIDPGATEIGATEIGATEIGATRLGAADTTASFTAADPEGSSDLPAVLDPGKLPSLSSPPKQLGDVLVIAPDPPPGVSVVLPPAVAGLSGCGLVGAPLGTLGFTSAILGVLAVVGVLGAGLNPLIGVPLFLGSFCIGVPSFCMMGPATVGAGAGGAIIATRSYNDRSGLPGLIAMIPPLLLALAGSALATVGIFYTLGALLAISPGQGRAGLAMLSAGLLTSLLAGPLAAFLAIGADVAFGGPFEEGLSGSITDAFTGPADGNPKLRSERKPKAPSVAMAF